MSNVVQNSVEGIGVSDLSPLLPPNPPPQYFTQICVAEVVTLPEEKPDMEELLSVMVDTEIISLRLIQTPIGNSLEGQQLLGWKLSVELKIRQKAKYIACDEAQSVHAAHFDKFVSSIFIILPPSILVGPDFVPVKELFEEGRLIVTPYIEDIFGQKRDKRTIFKNICLLLNVTVI